MGLHRRGLQRNLPARHRDGGVKGDPLIHLIGQQPILQVGILDLNADQMVIQRKAAHIVIMKDRALHPDRGIVHPAINRHLGLCAAGDDAIGQFERLFRPDIGAQPAEPQPHIDIKRTVARRNLVDAQNIQADRHRGLFSRQCDGILTQPGLFGGDRLGKTLQRQKHHKKQRQQVAHQYLGHPVRPIPKEPFPAYGKKTCDTKILS